VDLGQPVTEHLHSDFAGAKDNGSGADNWSYNTCKCFNQIITTNKQTLNFFTGWSGCLSCRPTNRVKALKHSAFKRPAPKIQLDSYICNWIFRQSKLQITVY